ncbi:hypothetical protein PDESU_00034 [Pontiella desulfatans]|uniref:Uncharacterized protein n=1 Tax=Pontiella desulfatans TaxID=2750659 RepID=A0A6C2TV61_PONDE|nr:hypothetical protein [Pontiella desulfatans]VGO11490.1 hypothetical protein PDESU_00034 [Pontiella desulfatans]
MKINTFVLLVGSAMLWGCSPISTDLHKEQVDSKSVSMEGSYDNAVESLVVISHSWKVIAVNKKEGTCEWAFQVDLKCNNHPDYKRTEGFRPDLPIELVEYKLYDSDGFLLDSTYLRSKQYIYFGETKTLQGSSVASLELLKRASAGQLRIKAGYDRQKK